MKKELYERILKEIKYEVKKDLEICHKCKNVHFDYDNRFKCKLFLNIEVSRFGFCNFYKKGNDYDNT
jgi:hypothetical protein